MTTPQQKIVGVERAWYSLMASLSNGWLYRYDRARTANLLLDRLMARR